MNHFYIWKLQFTALMRSISHSGHMSKRFLAQKISSSTPPRNIEKHRCSQAPPSLLGHRPGTAPPVGYRSCLHLFINLMFESVMQCHFLLVASRSSARRNWSSCKDPMYCWYYLQHMEPMFCWLDCSSAHMLSVFQCEPFSTMVFCLLRFNSHCLALFGKPRILA